MKNIGENYSSQKDQQVQRPWGKQLSSLKEVNVVFEQSRVGEGEMVGYELENMPKVEEAEELSGDREQYGFHSSLRIMWIHWRVVNRNYLTSVF